jgi:23S rRNA (guanosine2251-2'-O)-methyltransferase
MRQDPRKKGRLCKSRYVYGFHPVQEQLRATPQEVSCFYCLPHLRDTALVKAVQQAGIPLRYESAAVLDQLAGGGRHQGVVACLAPFRFTPFSEISSEETNLLLVLDGVIDPRNLGALLRTAEAVGVGGVILPRDRTAPITPVVVKASAGATAYLRVCQVANLARCLDALRLCGYWIVGLWPEASQSLYALDITNKIVLVVGGEEKGLRPLVRHHCDFLVTIPMQGRVESLNASVAGAVALYEFFRRTLAVR